MFVQISPNEKDNSETLCSLNFASRVRGIELGPAKKQLDNTELLKYKQMVEKWKQDMKVKDEQMRKMEETMFGLEAKVKERDIKNKTLQEKVKELELQLLVERKLARQHVDTKITEYQTKQQHGDENIPSKRPPLATIPLGSNKSSNETSTSKEMVNLNRPPLSESTTTTSNDLPPLPNGSVKYNDLMEKENNTPEMAERLQISKSTGRFSVCPKRILPPPAPRRSTLAPMPYFPITSTSPSRPHEKSGTSQVLRISPKMRKSNGKMLSSILRRSMQKRMQMKPYQRQQPLRRVGINVGMEKVRLSIGSRGRLAHRVLLTNARKAGLKETPLKQIQKEKERWI
ncbi:hypothetical protein BRARA_B02014 [Brassica rapa]|nr:hypothetical protein BRARA_B02014 [Brassica rapa]